MRIVSRKFRRTRRAVVAASVPLFALVTAPVWARDLLRPTAANRGWPDPPPVPADATDGEAPLVASNDATARPAPRPWDHGELSGGEHYLVHADGTPFFWLGDTAWELFHRLNRGQIEYYLDNRRAKGFNVIQAVVLAILDGLNTPNANGDIPLLRNDPRTPAVTDGSDPDEPTQYDYWDHVDFAIRLAEEKGLYVGLFPAWGDKVTRPDANGPVVFDPGNARVYGEWIGRRLRDRPNIIWILGGDRPATYEGKDFRPVWRAMAEGIQQGQGKSVLMTFHPGPLSSSSAAFHSDDWLRFNMLQSSHAERDAPVWGMVTEDYGRTPTKPVIDGEPNYEDHPVNWSAANGYFRDHDVRKQAYRAVFAGALGHTYGHHSVWQMYAPGRSPVDAPDRFYVEALDRPGAAQMQHLRSLMESRPFLSRIPDQGLLVANAGTTAEHIRATRSADGNYAFVYIPTANQVATINLARLSVNMVRAWWYDPRRGAAEVIGEFQAVGELEFTTPGGGPDWVLVLDDAEAGFAPPGTVAPPP